MEGEGAEIAGRHQDSAREAAPAGEATPQSQMTGGHAPPSLGSPLRLTFTGSGTVLTRSPALLHAGSLGVGLGGESSAAPAAQHGGRPEERPGTQPACGPAGPGHAAASGQERGNLQTPANTSVTWRHSLTLGVLSKELRQEQWRNI